MIALLTLGLYPSSGGPSKSVQAFARALEAQVISWVDPVERARESLVWDVTLEVTGRRTPVLKQLQVPAAGTDAAEDLIARARLVSVHSFWRWHIPWVHRVCRRHDVPYWYVPHGGFDPYVMQGSDALLKRAFLAGAGRAFLRDAATVIYSTRREREKARGIVGHDRAELIHWPLEEAEFRKRDGAARAKIRAKLGIPEQSVCFLYLGRLAPMKRPLETIAAFAAAELEKAHLIVVGNEFGVSEVDCRRAAAAVGVAERVHVTGPAYGAEKYGYFDASDAYVSLSIRENFNFCAAEALASGLPLMLSPGNDLGLDLAGLNGVIRLGDDRQETAIAALRTMAEHGPTALAGRGAGGADWARAHLSRDIFTTAIREAAERIARPARQAFVS